MDSAGFYKNDQGELLRSGPNFIEGPGFALYPDRPADRVRTAGGWAWFDTEADARAAYGIAAPAE